MIQQYYLLLKRNSRLEKVTVKELAKNKMNKTRNSLGRNVDQRLLFKNSLPVCTNQYTSQTVASTL